MKVVGIGLNKTGTSTLGACCRHWGLKHMSCNKQAFQQWLDGDSQGLMQWLEQYDSFDDWPWPLIYREIDSRFPGTKFLLTRRKDPDTWFRSLCRHAERTGPTEIRKQVYGHEMPHRHRDDHIRIYEDHLRSVRKYFGNRPDDLLEVCWEEGDGWTELAAFLGLEKPDIAFPHENRRKGLRDWLIKLPKRVRKQVKHGARHMLHIRK
jgi:hypothetical protein